MNDERARLPGAWILGLATLLLGRRDVARVVAPAVADLRFEVDAARTWLARVRVRAGGTLAVLGAVALAVLGSRIERARALSPGAFAPVAACVLAGALALRALGLPALAGRQLVYAGVAAVAALAIATSREGQRPARAWPAALLAVAVAGATAAFGEPFGGARRWLTIAALRVQPIDLAKPLLVVAIAGLVVAGRRRAAVLVAAAFALAAALAHDPVSAAVASAVAVAALLGARASRGAIGAAAALGAGAIALALGLRGAPGARDPHTDGLLAALVARFGFAAAAAVVALAALASARAVAFARQAPPAARVVAASAAAAFVAQLVAQPACGEGVALLSYGGSGLVTMAALFALAANAARPRAMRAGAGG